MERDLVGDVKRALARGCDDFDRLFPGETDRFAAALAHAFTAVLDVVPRFGREPIASRRRGERDQYSVGWHLLADACNGLLGSFSLLQRGYETETLAATRVVFERVAVALVLVDNPDLVEPFMEGREPKLATRAIRPATEVVPQLGRTWAALSEVGSHVGHLNIGTSVGSGPDEPLKIAIGGRLSLSGRGFAEGASLLIDIADGLLTEAPEAIFLDEHRRRAVLGKKGTAAARKGATS